ncbi:MAG: cupin domain-containing protein, partial [Firmicutes bacterium]|nr:cupin domain-containing protein [Bacillota bacterium]
MQNKNSLDRGPNPSVINIANETLKNDTYRTAIWTGNNMQATVMSINPKDDVGLEIHPDNDQFFRIESGCGMVLAGKSK